MKKILAIFKKINILKVIKIPKRKKPAAQEDAPEQEMSANNVETEAEAAAGENASKPGKLKGRFKGKRKILIIILAAIIGAGAGIGIAMLKLGVISIPTEKKTAEHTTAESSADKASTESEGGHSAEAAKTPEPQIAKITTTAVDIDLGELEGHLASDYIKILRTKNYTIRYNTTTVYNGQPFNVETTYAVYGDNVAMASADRSTVILNQNVYMMDHTNKTMISWRATETENLRTIDTSDLKFIGSTESDGLVCEEYTTSSTRIKFFFRDGALVEVITVVNNQDADMDILEFKEGVPMDLFVVPGDYQNTNISS